MVQDNNGRHIAPNPQARAGRRAEQATNHLLFRVFTAIILVAVAFCAGFVLRSQTELVASWGVPLSDAEK